MDLPRIARVFPTKTKMCPGDKDAYFGLPHFWTPQYEEVHISVTFTWDLPKVEQLMKSWSKYGRVLLGGPAYGEPCGEFVPGRYLKKGVTITSRGCPNNCSFCLVPEREGPIRELIIWQGNIIQDSNLLACSAAHVAEVFTMLKSQRKIVFAGGLEAKRITEEIAERLSELNIKEIWLSYDMPNKKTTETIQEAVRRLKVYFSRRQIRCYVLIGYEDDTIEAAESRLLEAWEMGTLPFAMRYRLPTTSWEDSFVYRERPWNELTARWTQAKTIFSRMKKR